MLHVPGHQALAGAESSDAFVLLSLGVLEVILGSVISHVEDNGSSEQGEDGVLLELEAHDRRVGLSIGSHSHSLLRISDCVVEDSLGSSNAHGGNTESSG